MENFIFALNATLPVFLIILLGWLLQRLGMMNDAFCRTGNQYVFKVALPVSLFNSISSMDFYSDFNLNFCLFCFVVTLIMFSVVWFLAWKFMRVRTMIGAFVQGSVRSSAAILGVAFAVNIYGSTGMVPMMILSAVPLFNVFAVMILTFSPSMDGEEATVSGKEAIRKALINVARNPIILGILIGFPFSLLRIQLPLFLTSALSTVGGTASPIALLIIGASFSGAEALTRWKPAAVATTIKLVALPLVFLPIAALLGFRNSEMVAILIMLGSPATVASYVMTRSMHQDAVLTSNIIVLTTLFSSVTITLWLLILRSLVLI